MQSYEKYLRESAVPRETLDVFLDPDTLTYVKFDAEMGYVHANSIARNGLDNSLTISTNQKNGARTAHMYAYRPCRINTYGDSLTECSQVNDGETWQEYLAAHLGEPVRNFGVGGYGTYQAYLRMLRVEKTDAAADNVVLYLAADDHCRSVMRCRHAVICRVWDHMGGFQFHNNFWANIEMDLDAEKFVERENLLSTPESLYKMTYPDFMVEALKDDLMVQLNVAGSVDPKSLDLERISALADILGEPHLDISGPEAVRESATRLTDAYGFASARRVLDLTLDFCRERGKTLMVLTMLPKAMGAVLNNKPRYDQTILDYLADKELPHFDMIRAHFEDYQNFTGPFEEYMKRYLIGHYSPAGNHFFAFSMKDVLIEMLEPKPITYRDDDGEAEEVFKGYVRA
ncbi:hypothetical protein ACFL1X_06875 [Candidatus Hydrogenedentota bacterium]